MTATTITTEKLDIGRVIQTTFQVISRRLGLLAALSAVLILLPSLVMLLAAVPAFRGFVTNPTDPFPFPPGFISLYGFASPVLLAIGAISRGALLQVTIQDLSGGAPSFADALTVGVRRCLPVMGVIILNVLAVVGGAVLLVVPGLMIAVAFCVALPVQVAEQPGVFATFARTRALTRNNRWRIFGLFVLFAIVSWVFEMVIGAITGGFMPRAFTANLMLQRMGFSVIETFVTAVIATVGLGVLYAELRRIKEGVGAGDLASVFD